MPSYLDYWKCKETMRFSICWSELSQAMAWILVVGHALNLVLNKVSATSVYSFGNCGLEA